MAKQTTTANLSKTLKEKTGKYHDFDGHWKGMIEEFIEDFIAFFLPQLYPQVDFSFKPEFLDTELQNILESIGTSKRILDKLVKVRLKNGTYKWLLIHIEVQSYFEKLFAERMFLLYAMIFSKFRQKILGIVIYTNKKIPKIFDKYEDSGFGSRALYEFIAYKVVEQKEDKLLSSDNIFALFVLANLYVIGTNKKDTKRLAMKKKLFELAIERNINLDRMRRLIKFVDGMMQLSKDLKEEYDNYLIKTIKPEITMVAESPSAALIDAVFDKLEAEYKRMEQKAMKQAESYQVAKLREYEEKVKEQEVKAKEQEAKAKEQEAKAKEQEAKAKEQEAKAKEQEAKAKETQYSIISNLYLKNDWSIVQIAELLKITNEEVQNIVDDISYVQGE